MLARAGYGSRREIEKWIENGRISVNGKVSKLGDRAEETDTIRIDGKAAETSHLAEKPLRVIGYFKPEGQVVTRSDEKGRETVFDHLPHPGRGDRWIAVGRLDINSSGLLLFTNDGELANRLMHPSYGIDREYAVRVMGEVDNEMMQTLRDGVELEDGPAKFTDIVPSGGEGINKWFHVALMEGRKREVRRLWESQGIKVSRLSRVRFGPIFLPREARMGSFWDLELDEIRALLTWVKLDKRRLPIAKPRDERKATDKKRKFKRR